MKRYGILTDSSISLSQKQAEALDVTIAPLTLTYNGQEFEDQITMTYEDVRDILARNEVLMTSQPNIGSIIKVLDTMKAKNYDHIFVLSLSSYLSGTFSAFNHAVSESGIHNISVVDTFTIAGPVQAAIHCIRKLEQEDASVETVLHAIAKFFDNTTTYIYPRDLKQLIASGRISKSAATLASLLKIKPILKFENKGEKIEKFNTARTEAKAFDIIIQDLDLLGVNPKLHDIYILGFESSEVEERFKTRLLQAFPNITIYSTHLPAAAATHAGVGTFAVQWTMKP